MSTEFNGDNKKLIASINALLALDAKGCLAPHGIGEHARVLLQTCEARLPEQNYPSEAELIASGLGYPIGKEDAVKLHYAGYRSEVITVLEAWEAIGHDIHINPDKQELMESLRNMAEICAANGSDMPAEQHQGEPVHMMRSHGSCCWEESSGEGLDIALSMPEEYEVRTLYNHPAPADAGEVERLRADLAEMTKSYESLGAVYAGTQKGFENMRAQLVERDALLLGLLPWMERANEKSDDDIPELLRLRSAISASAELSEPVERKPA